VRRETAGGPLPPALSTMWGIGRFAGLGAFFSAAEGLGFRRFELNHGVDSAMLEAAALDGRRIDSIHEPCPADISTAELKRRNWLVSAPLEADRQAGVAAVRRSVELAHRLEAPVVIVHAGRVDADPQAEQRLVELYEQGAAGTRQYALARERLVSARAAAAGDNLRSVRRSLEELADCAAPLGIRLALENRFHYLDIPLPQEMEELLGLGWGDTVGYWHDVGHAVKLEALGFDSLQRWLGSFGSAMIGVHLHDAMGIRDHLAPGLGQVDWPRVARLLPAGALRTCEFGSFNSPDQVAAGLELLSKSGCLGEAPPLDRRGRLK